MNTTERLSERLITTLCLVGLVAIYAGIAFNSTAVIMSGVGCALVGILWLVWR